VNGGPESEPGASSHTTLASYEEVDVEYKVLSQPGTPGKSSAEKLEQTLNSWAAEGWRVVNTFMVSSPWTLSTSQIMVVLERVTPAAG
jgi:hypothetical protein